MHETIYKITNRITQKSYVGRTIDLPRRLRQHQHKNSPCRYLNRSISKHGFQNFDIEILEVCPSISAAERELFHIVQEKCLAPFGYNLVLETEQGRAFHSSSRQKLSKSSQRTNRGNMFSFIGVKKNHKTFMARLMRDGKTYSVPRKSALEAAQYYDIMALYFFGRGARLNFLESLSVSDETIRLSIAEVLNEKQKSSKCKGVSFHKSSGRWRAYYYIGGKQVTIGLFANEDLAIEAQRSRQTNQVRLS